MIPVQVGTRIVDIVDVCRAARMAKSPNVKVVKDRRSKSIVRLIVSPMVLGKGDVDTPSLHQSSCRAHKVERLFDEEGSSPTQTCSPNVFALKPAFLFLESSLSFRHIITVPVKASGEKPVVPTTNCDPARSGLNSEVTNASGK